MNLFKKGLTNITAHTGLSSRTILWSLLSLVLMFLFSVLFTYPINKKIRSLDQENTEMKTTLEEQIMLEMLQAKLDMTQKQTFPKIKKLVKGTYEEEKLLELPSVFENLAEKAQVTLVSIQPQSINDGAQLSVDAIFQGDIANLYTLLINIGNVPFTKKIESLNILAIADAEQMELKFKVPLQ